MITKPKTIRIPNSKFKAVEIFVRDTGKCDGDYKLFNITHDTVIGYVVAQTKTFHPSPNSGFDNGDLLQICVLMDDLNKRHT